MNPKEIKNYLTELRAHLATLPLPASLREKALMAYSVQVLTKLDALLKKPEGELVDVLLAFFKENWGKFNGTALSFTAIPQADITVFLCQLAEFVAVEKNKNLTAGMQPLTPIQVLIPTLLSVDSLDLRKYPNLDDSSIPLPVILKTHVLGLGGRYLLPVKLLMELSLETQPLHNPYYDVLVEPEAGNLTSYTFIDPSELERLTTHSLLTGAVLEAKQNYDLLVKEDSSFLGHLREFCKQLAINSAHGGLGTIEHAASGVYEPIFAFMEYYHEGLEQRQRDQIPEPLRKYIEALHIRVTNWEVNKEALGKIETCSADIRKQLIGLMSGNEAILAAIALSGAQKASLISRAENDFRVAVSVLGDALASDTYTGGQDKYALDRQLLNILQMQLTVASSEDLELFNALSVDEITELLKNPALQAQIIKAIGEVDSLILWFTESSPEKISAFLNGVKNVLVDVLLYHPLELIALLRALEPEKIWVVCEALKDKFTEIFYTTTYIGELLALLSPDQCVIVLRSMKELFIERTDINILLYLNSKQIPVVVSFLNNERGLWLREKVSLYSYYPEFLRFGKLAKNFCYKGGQWNDHERLETFVYAMKSHLSRIIESSGDLRYLLKEYLTDDTIQREPLFKAMGGHLMTCVLQDRSVPASMNRGLMECFNPTRQEAVNSLLALIDYHHSSRPSIAFTKALMDDEKTKIKTSFHELVKESQSWSSWGYSFFAWRDPLDALLEEVSKLGPDWTKKLTTALDLELTSQQLLSNADIKAALKEYFWMEAVFTEYSP